MKNLHKDMPIGVIDSGVGGLSVMKVLHKMLPHEDFIYLGDTARTPYGVRPEAEIRGFVEEMFCYLEKQGVKQVIIACNTLSMLGVPSLQKEHQFLIEGMSKGEHILLAASKNKKIGVFATPFTISTEAHKKAILAVDASAEVCPVPCPKFVTLVEGEKFGTQELKDAVAEYATPIKAAGCDVLILSCTHFPFAQTEIEAELGAGVHVFDPAEETALNAIAALEAHDLLKEAGEGSVKLCCTADLARAKRLAERMLGDAAADFTLVKL